MLSRSCIGNTGTSAASSSSDHSAAVRAWKILAQIVAAGSPEEILPLLVVVNDDANIAVGGFIRPPVARQMPRIAALVERRLKGETAHVIAHHETRHGLEHRNIHALPTAGAVAMHEAGAD